MAKDPAFLFYPSDFLTGTMLMTDQEVGQYIRILCYQHQHGHIDAIALQRLCGGNATPEIASKFSVDSEGKYYNERLEIEIQNRRKRSEINKLNANMRWHSDGNANGMPFNNSILSNKKKKVNTGSKEKRTNVKGSDFSILDSLVPEGWPAERFAGFFREFWDMRIAKKKPLTENAVKRRIKQLYELSGGDIDLAEKICLRSTDARWDEFYPLSESQKQKSNGKLVRDQA